MCKKQLLFGFWEINLQRRFRCADVLFMIFKHWAFFHTRLILVFLAVISQFSSPARRKQQKLFSYEAFKLFLWALHCTWKKLKLNPTFNISLLLFYFSKRCVNISEAFRLNLYSTKVETILHETSLLRSLILRFMCCSTLPLAREKSRMKRLYVARATAKSIRVPSRRFLSSAAVSLYILKVLMVKDILTKLSVVKRPGDEWLRTSTLNGK